MHSHPWNRLKRMVGVTLVGRWVLAHQRNIFPPYSALKFFLVGAVKAGNNSQC